MNSEKQYIDLFKAQRNVICGNSCDTMNAVRSEAFERFAAAGFPSQKNELYKYTDIDKAFAPDYGLNLRRVEFPINPYEAFRCNVPNMSTSLYFVENDAFYERALPHATLPQGVYVGSLMKAAAEMPQIVGKYYAAAADMKKDPIAALNTMFALAKVRAAESVFRTRGGLLHAPGGVYYAAIWCNDQPEYVNPFFPQLGYAKGNEAALNSFLHFARYMNPEYRYIPWSVIAEGYDTYGPFDRGDAAMLAYGAGRYALQMGDIRAAEALWPLIEWTLEYCRRKLNEHGVVASEADELENRFPAGDANLCTSSLYYDALRSAAWLAEQTGRPQRLADEYRRRAETLRENIERFFGATVEGYATYRYYEGNDILRSWICIPLVMDIFERREATVAALLSPRLWTENGMLTAAGSDTFWDRTTLYALRGIYAAGFREEATERLRFYSQTRLLGEHVPYAVEAWPEGDQRHLSAESGLYCRIVTEGMFGFRPTGFRSFTLTPQLPDAWNQMTLRRMYACAERPYDIIVKRTGKKLHIRIERDGSCIRKYTADNGTTIRIEL